MRGTTVFSGRSTRKIHQNFAKTIEYERMRRMGIDVKKEVSRQSKQKKG